MSGVTSIDIMPATSSIPRIVRTKYSVQLLLVSSSPPQDVRGSDKEPTTPAQHVLLGRHTAEGEFPGRITGAIKPLPAEVGRALDQRLWRAGEKAGGGWTSPWTGEGDGGVAPAETVSAAGTDHDQCVRSLFPAVDAKTRGSLAYQDHAFGFCEVFSKIVGVDDDESHQQNIERDGASSSSFALDDLLLHTRARPPSTVYTQNCSIVDRPPVLLRSDEDLRVSEQDPVFPAPAPTTVLGRASTSSTHVNQVLADLITPHALEFSAEVVSRAGSMGLLMFPDDPRVTSSLGNNNLSHAVVHGATLEFFEKTEPGTRFLEYVFFVDLEKLGVRPVRSGEALETGVRCEVKVPPQALETGDVGGDAGLVKERLAAAGEVSRMREEDSKKKDAIYNIGDWSFYPVERIP